MGGWYRLCWCATDVSYSNRTTSSNHFVQCETVDGVPHDLTGETVVCNPQTGFYGQNAAQGDGACLDYRVRFYCP